MPKTFFAAPAVLAAAALVATPAVAVDLPLTRSAPAGPTGVEASQYGPVITVGSSWGWRGGYRGRHHRRGSTAGDILTGVLILGTIAAVANASKRAAERRPYPDRYPYPDRPNDYRPNGPQGLEGAADLCLREVERDARANEVTRVERNAGGWLVTGSLADGAGFTCSIGADGRIDRLEIGGRARDLGSTEGEDEAYRSAGADVAGPQPAYPGGPLPGEPAEGDVDVDSDPEG